MEMVFVGMVILLLVAALVKNLVTPAVGFLAALSIFMLFGVISVDEALAGFSNPTLFAIGSLFIIAKAVEKTIDMDAISDKILGKENGPRKGLAKSLPPVAAISGFINNTPIVAMLIQPFSQWAIRRGTTPSKVLIPLSYATILGGIITVIGTSTNLVVSGLLRQSGFEPIGFFEISKLGVPVALVGLATIIFFGPKLLPERKSPLHDVSGALKDFVMEFKVGQKLAGKSIAQAKLRHLKGVFLVAIRRANGDIISPAGPQVKLLEDDVLQFAGNIHDIVDLTKRNDLTPLEHKHVLKLSNDQTTYYEAVVGQRSPLVGKTLNSTGFRGLYQAAVLAIHRSGESITKKLGDVRFKVGDTLLIASDDFFKQRWANQNDFLLINEIGRAEKRPIGHGWLLAGIAAFIIGAHLLGAPLEAALLAGALLIVLTRVINVNEALGSIDFELLIMIGAAIGVAAGVDASGLAQAVVDNVLNTFTGLGDTGMLIGIVLGTLILTELVTNAAAASLMFPIAISSAAAVGVDPRPFAIAIAITASLSFLTPVGYQTNTMVYGPGGYRFTDYLRLGWLLTVISLVAIIGLFPLL